jgi:chromosome segregation protein
LEAASRELEAAEAARLRAVEERRSAEGRTAAATAAHEEAQAAAAEARRQLAEADAELGGLTTRLETLRELAAALQREGRPLEGLLQVPAGLELAAQAALERWLGAEIAPDERSAVQSHASEHRKRLVWPVTAGRGRPPKGTQPLADLVGPGSAGTQVRDMLLGRVFLAPDLATAEAALRHLPEGGLLVTRDGDALAPGWLARGPFSPSPLTLLGDQRRLEDAHAGLARSRDDLVRRVSAAEAALGEAGAALEGASAAFAQAQELERRCAEEEHRARLSLEAGRERQSRENERAARDEAAAGAMDGEIANLSSRLDSLAADLERLVAEERASADRLAASREQRQRLASELDQRARARAEAQARVEANDREMVAADQAAGRLRERLSEARGEFSALETRLREAERSVEAGRAALLAQPAAEEPHVRAEELTLEQANHLARQAEDAHLRASVDLASIVTAQEQAAEELERARVELAEARGRMGEDDLAEIEDGDGSVDWRRVQREVTRRQRELAELGPVNALAPALLERDSARLSLIESQHDDVAGSRAALLRLAGELREVIGSRFDAVLGAVGWHFQETFGELFDGGQSSLRLTEGPAEEQGIEIVAQPPGKRAQALSLLSGGERAMTCLAFIFALEQVNPSPFYVFDEVDAALDDTRVTRFARLLKRLSQDRQFIVVTHNHHTMAQADVLYGITAADSGVSQVLTVTLEDASSHRVGAQTA